MKTLLIIMFITQGFGVDGSQQIEYPSQEACDHALSQMVKTKDTNRGWHRGTQTVAFCAPEGASVTHNGSVIDKLRAQRKENLNDY